MNNVRIVKRASHYAVYKGDILVGVAGTFAGIWSIARGVV